MNKLILLIPDAHVTPQDRDNMWRFDALGKLIVKRRPDLIVQLGDFVSMESLSHWDRNKRLLMEGRRYIEDIKAGQIAIEKLFMPLLVLRSKQRHNKQRLYTPNVYWFEGNHEHWCEQYLEQHPEMEHFIKLEQQLTLYENIPKYRYIPYRQTVKSDGITYCHAPMMKNNQPVSGKYAVQRALERHNDSIVFGHLHRYESVSDKRIDSNYLSTALTCGCFFVDTPDYAEGSHGAYWKGVTFLHQYDYGQFDTEQISIERLKNEFN